MKKKESRLEGFILVCYSLKQSSLMSMGFFGGDRNDGEETSIFKVTLYTIQG